MSDRLAIILASGDAKVLEAGLLYARNAVKQGWMQDVRLFLFGPSQVEVATDPTLREALERIIAEGTRPMVSKTCSDKYSVSEVLAELGCIVEYIGSPISEAIREGFVPMVW